jgi:acetyl-CoA C-acetyltransferase
MAALDAGWDVAATGVSIDRFCGAGLTAVGLAAMGVLSGQQDLVVGGGIEKMSDYDTMDVPAFIDSDNEHLRARYPTPHQGVCADLVATLDGFSREEADHFALESQRRAAHAMEVGYFAKSLISVHDHNGEMLLDTEDFIRPGITLAEL